MSRILATSGLCKKYKRQMAVNGVDMTIEKGDIYGFVGENGSGKTTVIRLITGLIFPQEGSFELFGIKNDSPDILAARKKVGAIVESPSIYLNLSAYDNLKTQATLLGIDNEDKIAAVLADVGLKELLGEKKHAGDFSLGMRQRLGIAMALLGDPDLLILDEPMNGLDPAGIVEIRELILKLNRERGITFLISSHILTELSLVATKYGIISTGRLIREITSEELQKECAKTTFIAADDTIRLAEIAANTLSNECNTTPEGITLYDDFDLTDLLTAILSAGLRIQTVHCSQTSFEDYYLSVIGGAK